jgi:hypothetical protein
VFLVSGQIIVSSSSEVHVRRLATLFIKIKCQKCNIIISMTMTIIHLLASILEREARLDRE